MKNENFCVFILTHGRPENVITYKELKKCNYTGKIFIVIDNEDKKKNEYIEKYGDEVLVFDKLEVSKTFDEADNFEDRRAIVYARNVCFKLAKENGYKYFIQFDDDYSSFHYRVYKNDCSVPKRIKNIDKPLKLLLDFYKSISADTIAIAQGGDFIGGSANQNAVNPKLRRKAMNSFICSTERPFKFQGRINEDVNTYTNGASKGLLMFTIPFLSLEQKTTQSNSGGMTDIYLDNGTYVKSFYSVIFQPSSVTIKLMGSSHKRLHHSVKWENTTPMIISEDIKKR
jgi:hypothetical protein